MADGHVGYVMPSVASAAYDKRRLRGRGGVRHRLRDAAMPDHRRWPTWVTPGISTAGLTNLADEISETLSFGVAGRPGPMTPHDDSVFEDAAWDAVRPRTAGPAGEGPPAARHGGKRKPHVTCSPM